MTDDEREKWLEGAEYYGDALENRNLVPVMAEDEIDVTVSFPAVKYDKDPSQYSSAKPEGFRQVYFKTFWNRIDNLSEVVENATSDLVELKESTEAARDGALTATTYAENVNAEVNGMTVRITNRNGQVETIDVSFDFYQTYSSVAEMNADIANIPNSRLVSIATNDKTSEENARIYQKRSDGTMIYIADLDQASASAWAEWLNSMKPQIQAAITQAASDHTRATTDHGTASSDHTTATSDHSTAQSDHTTSTTQSAYAKQQGDYAKGQGDVMAAWNAHQPYIGDGTTGDANYWYIWVNNQYVRSVYAKGDDLHWEEMTDAEKEALAQRVFDVLVFATVEETKAAINELT